MRGYFFKSNNIQSDNGLNIAAKANYNQEGGYMKKYVKPQIKEIRIPASLAMERMM